MFTSDNGWDNQQVVVQNDWQNQSWDEYKRDYATDDVYNLRNKTENVVSKILDNPRKDYRSTWLKANDLSIKLILLKEKNLEKQKLDAIANFRLNGLMDSDSLYETAWLWVASFYDNESVIAWITEYNFKWDINWYDLDLSKTNSTIEWTNDVLNWVSRVVIKNGKLFSCTQDSCSVVWAWENPFRMDFFDRNFDQESYKLWFFMMHWLRVYNLLFLTLLDDDYTFENIEKVKTSKWVELENCVQVTKKFGNPHSFTYCLDANNVPVFYRYIWIWGDEFPWITFYWEWYLNDYELWDWTQKIQIPNNLAKDSSSYKSYEKRIISLVDIIESKEKAYDSTNDCQSDAAFDRKLLCENTNILELSLQNNDPDACELINHNDAKYFCYVEHIKNWVQHDVDTVCKRFFNPDMTKRCMFEFEKYYNAVDLLKNLKSDVQISQRQISMVIRAMYDRDASVCDKLDKDFFKTECKKIVNSFLVEAKDAWFSQAIVWN